MQISYHLSQQFDVRYNAVGLILCVNTYGIITTKISAYPAILVLRMHACLDDKQFTFRKGRYHRDILLRGI